MLTARLAASKAGWVAGRSLKVTCVFRPAPRAWRIDCRPQRQHARDDGGEIGAADAGLRLEGVVREGLHHARPKDSGNPRRRPRPRDVGDERARPRRRGVQQGRKPHAEQRGEIARVSRRPARECGDSVRAASRDPRDRAARPGARRPPACVRWTVPPPELCVAPSMSPLASMMSAICSRVARSAGSSVAARSRCARACAAWPSRRSMAASSRSSRALSGEATRACSYSRLASSSLPAAAAVRAFATASSTARNRSASMREPQIERRIGGLCRLEAGDCVRRPVRLRLRETAADQRRGQRRLQRDGLVEARDGVVEVVLRQRDVAEPRRGRCAVGRALPNVAERALRSSQIAGLQRVPGQPLGGDIRGRRRRSPAQERRSPGSAARRAPRVAPSARRLPWPRSR